MKKISRFIIALLIVAVLLTAGLGVKQIMFPEVELMWSGKAADENPDGIAAQIDDAVLTNGQLQVYYWAQVTEYFASETELPDLRLPFRVQRCTVAEENISWERYFLLKALDSWHSAQALMLQGENEAPPLEKEYAPNEQLHKMYLQNKPATDYLYGYNDHYMLNTLHGKYIEGLPEMFEALATDMGYGDGETLARRCFGTDLDSLCAAAAVYNRGYAYFTERSYEVAEASVQAEGTVSFRHVLLVCDENDTEQVWAAREREAYSLLRDWAGFFLCTEGTFGQMAYTHSEDRGSQPVGGYYEGIAAGQLPSALDAWLFDEGRKAGDTAVLRTELGVHIVYFCEKAAAAREDIGAAQLSVIEAAKAKYPMTVLEDSIAVQSAEGGLGFSDFLYADIAHERYPQSPLYLQDDYGDLLYGNYLLRIYGCGISCLAMMTSYFTDTQWTPPQLCELLGHYCTEQGSDVRLFWQAPAYLDYYFVEYVYDGEAALQALKDGHRVIAKEMAGDWTSGGHYILLEGVTEDGQIIVRDSNIYNYESMEGYSTGAFDWEIVERDAAVYFIFAKKPVQTQACCRCGDPDELTLALVGDGYICPKCNAALLRRGSYLTGTTA